MPRTKRIQAPKRIDAKETKLRDICLKLIDEEEQRIIKMINDQMERDLQALQSTYVTEKAKYSLTELNMTIKDILSGEADSTFNSTKSSKKYNSTLMSSRVKRRSASAGFDDEGYTTAESSRGTTSGGRTTRRSTQRTVKGKPTSRSLSRNTEKKVAAFRTPADRKPVITNVGTITPKCKPNTPQLYMRRAQCGEQAWSNQGSPLLLTHTVTVEQVANVNIPLADGNLVSLLPHRGIQAQMPDIAAETLSQLEILRDNLIKVCSDYKQETHFKN